MSLTESMRFLVLGCAVVVTIGVAAGDRIYAWELLAWTWISVVCAFAGRRKP